MSPFDFWVASDFRSPSGILAAFLIVICGGQAIAEKSGISVTEEPWAGLLSCQKTEITCYIAYSPNWGFAIVGTNSIRAPVDQIRSAIETCERVTGRTCSSLANASVSDLGLIYLLVGMLSVKEKEKNKWLMCFSQFSQFKEPGSLAVYSFYFDQQQCGTGDGKGTPVAKVRAILDENAMRILREHAATVEPNTARPTFKDRSDRDLCNTLVYQNPDHIKEAKRRGLTDVKCRETLGN